jgi:hypothetical protein
VKEFLAVWDVSDIPDAFVPEAKATQGASNKAGIFLARKHALSATPLIGLAKWRLRSEELAGLFEADPKLLLSSFSQLENLLRTSKKSRIPVTAITLVDQGRCSIVRCSAVNGVPGAS